MPGYWGVGRALGLPRVRSARLVFALGAAGAALGAVVHGMTALAIHGERASGAPPAAPLALVASQDAFLVPLWIALGVATAVGSGLYASAVKRGRTPFPTWMCVANPLVLTGALFGIGAFSLLGRAFLVPAAPNLAHVAFFALAGWSLQPVKPET